MTSRWQKTSLIFLALLMGCATLKNEKTAQRPIEGQQYWLKASLYAGDFYDDNRTVLMDYRPFFAITDAQTRDGYTIYPHNPTHIIPAGTLLEVTAISFPKNQSVIKRPLFSAKKNVWVFFRVARERGRVNLFEPKPHVLMLPNHIKSADDVKKALTKILSKDDPNPWLLTQTSPVQKGIFLKRPALGMNQQQLRAALGPPESISKEKTSLGKTKELWNFYDYFAVLEDDQVVSIENLTRK